MSEKQNQPHPVFIFFHKAIRFVAWCILWICLAGLLLESVMINFLGMSGAPDNRLWYVAHAAFWKTVALDWLLQPDYPGCCKKEEGEQT